jgi:hypothetical protein
MNTSIVYHALGALVSIAAAYGVNHQLHPVFDVTYDPAEYSAPKGTLTLHHGSTSVEVPLMTTHVVTSEVSKLGRVYKIHELCVRAAADVGGTPQLELFADVARVSGGLTQDPNALLQTELPLLRAGRLGARKSYIMLDGTHPSSIVTGNLLFTEIMPVESGDKPVFQGDGRLEVQVETDHGIDMVTGRISGVITWDATGS